MSWGLPRRRSIYSASSLSAVQVGRPIRLGALSIFNKDGHIRLDDCFRLLYDAYGFQLMMSLLLLGKKKNIMSTTPSNYIQVGSRSGSRGTRSDFYQWRYKTR